MGVRRFRINEVRVGNMALAEICNTVFEIDEEDLPDVDLEDQVNIIDERAGDAIIAQLIFDVVEIDEQGEEIEINDDDEDPEFPESLKERRLEAAERAYLEYNFGDFVVSRAFGWDEGWDSLSRAIHRDRTREEATDPNPRTMRILIVHFPKDSAEVSWIEIVK
jgi:hypothetical protein